MSVTKLEVVLSALLVIIVCEAGYHLPEFLSSYCQGPVIGPTVSTTPAQIPDPVTPAPNINSVSQAVATRSRKTQQEDKPQATLSQSLDPSANMEAEVTDQVPLPLALIDPPDGFLTSPEQVAAFDMLRQQFAETLSASAQDPNSPEYRQQWEEAQETLDQEFASLFGVEAFNQQQNLAMRSALEQH